MNDPRQLEKQKGSRRFTCKAAFLFAPPFTSTDFSSLPSPSKENPPSRASALCFRSPVPEPPTRPVPLLIEPRKEEAKTPRRRKRERMKEKRKLKESKKRRKIQRQKRKRKESDGKSSTRIACPSNYTCISFFLFHCLKKRTKNESRFVTRTSFGPVLSLFDDTMGRPKTCTRSSPYPVSVVAREEKEDHRAGSRCPSLLFSALPLGRPTPRERSACVRHAWPSRFRIAGRRRVPIFLFCIIAKTQKNKQNRSKIAFSCLFCQPLPLSVLFCLPKPTNTSWVDAMAPHEKLSFQSLLVCLFSPYLPLRCFLVLLFLIVLAFFFLLHRGLPHLHCTDLFSPCQPAEALVLLKGKLFQRNRPAKETMSIVFGLRRGTDYLSQP